MIRSFIAILALFVATLFLPFWVQIAFYLLAILLFRYKFLFLIPAILADAWYAPSHNLSLQNNKTFLLVAGMLVVYFFIIKNTRTTQKYGLEKK